MTSLVGWALGDFIAQRFIGKAAFDMGRFVRLSAFGLLYHGPSGHYFYNWLDRKIEGTGELVGWLVGAEGFRGFWRGGEEEEGGGGVGGQGSPFRSEGPSHLPPPLTRTHPTQHPPDL
jgi:hypothetical protein